MPSLAKHVQLVSEVVLTAEPGQHASHGQSAGLSPLKCSHCGHSLWQIVTFGSSLGPAAAAADAAQSPSARTRIDIVIEAMATKGAAARRGGPLVVVWLRGHGCGCGWL